MNATLPKIKLKRSSCKVQIQKSKPLFDRYPLALSPSENLERSIELKNPTLNPLRYPATIPLSSPSPCRRVELPLSPSLLILPSPPLPFLPRRR
ncbi:hypothetical protein S245_028845 [Arachis hypogaea]